MFPAETDPRRGLFVDAYLTTFSVVEAAAAVQISRSAGYRWIADEGVQAEIQKQLESRRRRVQIDADYILETVKETVERCKSFEPLRDSAGNLIRIETPLGQEAVVCRFDSAAVLKGAEMLGKYLKLWTDKVEHSGPNGQPIPTEIRIRLVRPGEVIDVPKIDDALALPESTDD